MPAMAPTASPAYTDTNYELKILLILSQPLHIGIWTSNQLWRRPYQLNCKKEQKKNQNAILKGSQLERRCIISSVNMTVEELVEDTLASTAHSFHFDLQDKKKKETRT